MQKWEKAAYPAPPSPNSPRYLFIECLLTWRHFTESAAHYSIRLILRHRHNIHSRQTWNTSWVKRPREGRKRRDRGRESAMWKTGSPSHIKIKHDFHPLPERNTTKKKEHLSHCIDAANMFWPWMSFVDLGQHTHKHLNELPSPAIPMENRSCSVSLLEAKNIRKLAMYFLSFALISATWHVEVFIFLTTTPWYNIPLQLSETASKKNPSGNKKLFYSFFSFSLALTHPMRFRVTSGFFLFESITICLWKALNCSDSEGTVTIGLQLLSDLQLSSTDPEMGPARLFFFFFVFLFRPIAIELSSYIEREKQATCRVSCGAFSSWNKREPSIEALFLEVKEHFQCSLKKTTPKK